MHTSSQTSPAMDSVNAARLRATGQRAGKTRVLVVEDEQDMADLIKHTLERGGDIAVDIVCARGRGIEGCGRATRPS